MKTDNMPSLRRVIDLLTPVPLNRLPEQYRPVSGMDATVTGSVRITSAPQAGRDDDIGTHDVCPLTGGDTCFADTSACKSC